MVLIFNVTAFFKKCLQYFKTGYTWSQMNTTFNKTLNKRAFTLQMLRYIGCIILIFRNHKPLFHRTVCNWDAREDVQRWSPGLLCVSLQPVWLFCRHLQHHRSRLHVHWRHASAGSQRLTMCSASQGLQGDSVNAAHPVSHLFMSCSVQSNRYWKPNLC